jgi:hypothetical protein
MGNSLAVRISPLAGTPNLGWRKLVLAALMTVVI